MSFVLLHADRLATALVDDPIIPAADVPTLRDATALLAEAGRIRTEATERAAEAMERAYAEGLEQGRADGRAAGEGEMRTELFRLAVRAREEAEQRREEIATLALEVVRRIAGAIGDEDMVSLLAQREVAALVPDTAATVRVPPAALDTVSQRLAERPGIVVEADPALSGADCVIETALGRTHAGLETQLAQLERSWKQAREARDAG
jgi:type III secretion protein L